MSTTEVLSDAQRWGKIIEASRTSDLFLTQAELAELIEQKAKAAGVDITVDQSTVSRWERGTHEPALRARPFIAAALGVSAAVLFQRAAA
jgi:transcriptional regulator with XRE-family HTH domain